MFLLDNSDDWGFKCNQETDGLGFRVSNVIRKLMDYGLQSLHWYAQVIYYKVYNSLHLYTTINILQSLHWYAQVIYYKVYIDMHK